MRGLWATQLSCCSLWARSNLSWSRDDVCCCCGSAAGGRAKLFEFYFNF